MGKRAITTDPLRESSQFVKGVGPARQVLLSRLGIETVEDLLLHVPRKYYDRGDLVTVSKVAPGRLITFVATVLAASSRRLKRGRSMFTVAVGDETGTVKLVFFNQPYLEKQFNLSVFEQTTLELRTVFRHSNLATEHSRRFLDLFGESDLVKFAKFTPPAETAHQAVVEARTLVDATKPRQESELEEFLTENKPPVTPVATAAKA